MKQKKDNYPKCRNNNLINIINDITYDLKSLNYIDDNFNESKNIEVTLKLNSHNLDRLLKDFERFNYHVSASFNKENDLSNIEERYDSLMRYLNT